MVRNNFGDAEATRLLMPKMKTALENKRAPICHKLNTLKKYLRSKA